MSLFYTVIFLFEQSKRIDSIFINGIWSLTVYDTSDTSLFLHMHDLPIYRSVNIRSGEEIECRIKMKLDLRYD